MRHKIKRFFINFFRRLSVRFNYAFFKPSYITLDITHNCNLHCQHCHFWQTAPIDQLTFDQFKIIVDKLHQWLPHSQIQITGGEPFLNQHLLEMTNYAHSLGFSVHVNSNFTAISDHHLQLLANSGISSLSTSLDHHLAPVHNQFRGSPDAFQKTTDTIKKIKNLYPHLPIYINTVITRKNSLILNTLAKSFSKLPIDGLNFQVLIPTLNTNEKLTALVRNNPLWPKKKNIILDKSPVVANPLSQIIEIKKYYRSPFKVLEKITCTSGHNNFIIDWDGNIRICFNFAPIANIFTDNPAKIWNSKKAKYMRRQIRRCNQACKIVKCNRVDLN